jgi:membrane protease YdiL (CAAX protease family)
MQQEEQQKPGATQHERPGVARSIGLILVGYFSPVFLQWSNISPRFSIMLASLLIFVPAFLYVKMGDFSLQGVFKMYSVAWRVAAASVLVGVSLPFLIDELDKIVQMFLTMPPEWQEILYKPLRAESLFDWMVILTAGVLIGPVVEELLFRGLLQGSFEKRGEWWQAILQTSLIFALLHVFHFTLLQFFCLAVLLGFLSWRSGSVVPAIIVHMLNNAMAIISLNLSPDLLQRYEWHGHVYPPVLAFAACLLFYGVRWFYTLTEIDVTDQ